MPHVMMDALEYSIPVIMTEDEDRWILQLPAPWTNKDAEYINVQVRCMQGAKWDGDNVQWIVPKTTRNFIAMACLRSDMPYPFDRYDADLIEVPVERPLWDHQREMLNHLVTRRYCLVAAEQGTGKTLPLIEAMERSGLPDEHIWYASTISGIEAVYDELRFWQSRVKPTFFTYDGIIKRVDEYKEKQREVFIPRMLIYDESSRLKGNITHRSLACQWLADAVREEYGEEGWVFEATGTPAPKNAFDWWRQCEIACPGFLREGTYEKFKQTLSLHEWKDAKDDAGQSFPSLVTWWDDPEKCKHCGKYREEHGPRRECFKKSYKGKDLYYDRKGVNELSELNGRLQGLVIVKKKQDCLDLPDKHYRKVYCEPDEMLLRDAQNIVEMAASPIEAVHKLRELSDGFQYTVEESGEKKCPICHGTGESKNYAAAAFDPNDLDDDALNEDFSDEDYFEPENLDVELVEGACFKCGGTGKVPRTVRKYFELASPKLIKLREIMEDHEEVGRIVIFAGFHASIDRIQKMLIKDLRWTTLVADGRGWRGLTPSGEVIHKRDFTSIFRDPKKAYPRVAWLGHPKSCGMGLNLTASPTEVYFSNTFDGEDRMQSEDRGHRAGMDLQKGLTIIDLINLPTDHMILENLANKAWMQDMTMGVLKDRLANAMVQHAMSRKS